MNIEDRRQKEFYDKYPELFPNGSPICGFSCEEGWFGIITDMCDDLIAILNNSKLTGEDKVIPIEQLKEKFGDLRCYLGPIHESIFELVYSTIDMAIIRSSHTCEYCGKQGKIQSNKGWFKAMCDECYGQKTQK